jgi:hypothetical protein
MNDSDDIGAPQFRNARWKNTGSTPHEREQLLQERQAERAKIIAELDAANAADRERIERRRAEKRQQMNGHWQ